MLQSSSQFRFAILYVLITSVVLFMLNVYSANTTRDLLFRAKEATLQGKTQLVVSSMSGLESLTTDNVTQVINLLGDLDATRILVTDAEGQALYDSSTRDSAVGRRVLFSEIVAALEGSDVFYSVYETGALESHACMPVMFRERPIGTVYILEYDTDQGAIIAALEYNLIRISVLLGALVILASILFSFVFSNRMRRILQSIQMLREGEYSHKIALRGHDEVGILATEFNKLTDRLQESMEAQQQFVSDASHELKTPLASIKLLSDSIIQNDMDMATVREFAGDIGNEADRLARIAQNLLALSRADDAPRDDYEVVEAGPVAEKVIRLLTPMARLRDIEIRTRMELGCTVVTREDDLYQIIFNLVENGIKYNVDGGQLMLQLSRVEDDVVLVVEDTGVGIPEESIPYIFNRFYRVDKARSRQAGGSGLGLSIVYQLVNANYGSVRAESRSEGGTRFTVVFPYFGLEDE